LHALNRCLPTPLWTHLLYYFHVRHITDVCSYCPGLVTRVMSALCSIVALMLQLPLCQTFYLSNMYAIRIVYWNKIIYVASDIWW
jgi:hypothetical protein